MCVGTPQKVHNAQQRNPRSIRQRRLQQVSCYVHGRGTRDAGRGTRDALDIMKETS